MTQAASRKTNIPKAYDPKSVEGRIYESWVKGGYFTPTIDPDKKPFVVIMPPPNVTGELHMGHALTTALEDLMVRWHRMRGEPTLFLPGSDHAGIATQVVVERMIASDGVSRHDLGREKFVERVWSWVDQYGSRIDEQLKRLGASCDWTRKAFTLDEGPSKAVRTTFVNLYKKGLIYRGERMTNWCPRCRTALSDLEVKYREENAALYHVRYEMEDGSGSVTIATTRPETLLGDTAVAVNQEDERYKHLIGKNVVLPVLGRIIPIVADEAVELDFGTGALKVTPGHDPVDFEIGQRHDLPTVSIMELDGTLNETAGSYQGQTMSEARKNIVQELEKDGLLEMTEPYRHSVGHCDRCDETVEPIVSKQWWMSMKPLAKPAREAVAEGRIGIVPERFSKVYYNWMDNICDWCVSRQLWWGHRLPVWYCQDCAEVVVELEDPKSCPNCDSAELERDPDVLDTWFSSALWPHSTLGWPDETADLEYFHPSTVLETGHDILFFWVARMVMMGLENTGQIPFETVYLHGLVRDPSGVKMSKSKGNVMDPLDLIDLYGADALRFALNVGNSPGNDMRLNEQKMEASRNFANKLWNAARFVMSNLGDEAGLDGWHDPDPKHRHDRWILSRLNRVAGQVDGFMKEFQFGEAQRVVHDFLWNEYCDWYIEMAKVRMRSDEAGGPSPLPVLAHVLERVLRLLHPFMPFVTEEIWRTLVDHLPEEPDRPEALIVAPYPESDEALIDEQAESEIGAVIEIVRSVRNLRAEFRIEANQRLEAALDAPALATVLEEEAPTVKSQAGIDPLIVGSGRVGESSNDRVALVLTGGTVTVPLGGLVDLDRERARLADEREEISKYVTRLSARLEDEQFVSKAPEDVIERERERLASSRERTTRIEEMLSRLDSP
ncbi:MAG: valine--tRNA ligase [Chloroflexi bacterium]|nr:valine--tRNA ligase [Chloroflexota bacterium]